MAENFRLSFNCDFAHQLQKTSLSGFYGTGNSNAHTFVISMYKNGEPVVLQNQAITGTFISYSNMMTIPITGGSIVNGKAEITLKRECYQSSGMFAVFVNVGTVTVFAGEGIMSETSTDIYYDPDKVIPSLGELLAQVEAVKTATAEANTATASANSATASANSATAMANAAAANAQTATTAANNATNSANSAANKATTAANNADVATAAVNDAVDKATVVASKSPYIGTNGNWYVYDVDANAYVDSGNSAQGTGSVSSVNGVWPDGDGNVPLTPADIGAVSVASVEENLLVNSDFRAGHVVNQRGREVYSGSAQYTISRWKTTNAFTSVTLTDEGILIENTTSGSAGYLAQPLYGVERMLGKEYTFAVCLADGRVLATSGRLPETLPTENQAMLQIMDGDLSIGGLLVTAEGIMARVWSNSSENSRTFRWAKLVRGTFAANEITSVEQDESQEMLKCVQTAVQLRGDLCRAYVITANILFFVVPIFNALGLSGGVTPTISGTFVLKTISGAAQSGFAFEINSIAPQGIGIKATKTGHGLTDGYLGTDGLVVITCDK